MNLTLNEINLLLALLRITDEPRHIKIPLRRKLRNMYYAKVKELDKEAGL